MVLGSKVYKHLQRTHLSPTGLVRHVGASPSGTSSASTVAVKETLEHRGVLQEVKARLRAEVFHVLNDQQEQRPPLTNENILITELIREYLDFNNYKYTASVLQSESGQPMQKLDRDFLKQELNVVEDAETGSVPLLYSIIGNYVSQRKDHNA